MLTVLFASMHACTLHIVIFLAILAYKQPILLTYKKASGLAYGHPTSSVDHLVALDDPVLTLDHFVNRGVVIKVLFPMFLEGL
jgi:hypothetical protein